jgi:hypothetical protein
MRLPRISGPELLAASKTNGWKLGKYEKEN